MKQESKDSYQSARIFYYTLHIFVILILLIYDNDLRIKIKNRNLIYPFLFFFLIFVTTFIWEKAGKNPGVYGYEKKKEIFEMDEFKDFEQNSDLDLLRNEDVFIENSEESFGESRESVDTGKGVAEIEKIKNEKYDNCDIIININPPSKSSLNSKNSKTENINNVKSETSQKTKIPSKRFCKKCQILQPYRTKHCNSCQACISKYDHHCFWIGGCVGELNLRKFFIMLFFQSLLFIWVLYLSLTGLAYNSDNYEKIHNLPENLYTKDYGSFVLLTIISIAALIFVFFLFFQYILFVFTNVTMWEATVPSKITYLASYKDGYMPFNEGVWINLKGIFCHGGVLRNWELKEPDCEEVEKSFNFLNNEYYSCC